MMIEHQYSDSELAKGCREHNHKFQKHLYDKYSGKMFAICMRYGKSNFDAEDILQEAFLKIFSKINQYKGEGSLEGWIRRVVVTSAIEHYRKKVKMIPMEDIDSIDVEDHKLVFNDFGKEDLLKVIRELAPGYRIIFNMYVIEGYNHKEIAEELNISEGTSKSQFARAREVIQRKLRKEGIVRYEQVNG